jgi:DNA-binding winged helix-turn-helix (wHTH) protein
MTGGFKLAEWTVEPQLNSLERNGRASRLEPKVMQVLVCLVDHSGELVTKERLIRAVWADTFVTDEVLTRCISELRKALNDDPKQPRFIETIPKGGYRLLLPVEPFVHKTQTELPHSRWRAVLLTRSNVKVDRVACPWLIRRFIDPHAEFLFVPEEELLEAAHREGATPFDANRFPEVKLNHRGERCTFEAILEDYKLTEIQDLRHGRVSNDLLNPVFAGLGDPSGTGEPRQIQLVVKIKW